MLQSRTETLHSPYYITGLSFRQSQKVIDFFCRNRYNKSTIHICEGRRKMAVRFDEKKNLFTLQTLDSTYQMKVDDHGVLLHTYYGAPADETDFSYLIGPEDRGFSGQPGDEKKDRTYSMDYYPLEYPVQGNPLVSILIPNKDQKDTLKQCLDSVFSKTAYANYEVIIIENNSQEKETWEYYEELKQRDNVKIVTWESGFNYSAINNFGEKSSSGEYLLFLNNDVEVINPHWMEELLGNCQRKEVGIVGAKLYYPDDTIQHAGTIIGIGGIAGHAFLNMPRSRSGYLHKASLQMDLSAVTAACMMMKRSVFESLGGFEEKLAVAFNDVDLCLRCVKAGYLVVYNPKVELYHYESKSRGSEDSEEKVRRFQQEIEFMRTRWIDLLKQGDPYYNKNLTLSKWNYSLRA